MLGGVISRKVLAPPNLPKEFVMLPNEVFALQCRAWYEEQGLVVDAANGQFAHCPLPERYGDKGYYLLWGHHQHQGLLQTRDIGECCFFIGDAKKWLQECDYFPDNYFELWEVYEKYSKKHLTRMADRGYYRNPVLQAKGVETHRKNGTGCFDPEFRKRATSIAQEANKKPIEVTKIETGEKFVFPSNLEAAEALNLDESCLSNVCHGRRKTTGGFTARYL